MGTRSRIGIKTKHGIVSCYHHWDGYPEWLGRTLQEHYNDHESATELIDGGDMSSCWSNELWGKKLPEGKFRPEYYTLRGDTDVHPIFAEDMDEYLQQCTDCWGEYAYLFVHGEWKCFKNSRESVCSPAPNPV